MHGFNMSLKSIGMGRQEVSTIGAFFLLPHTDNDHAEMAAGSKVRINERHRIENTAETAVL
jgi:hypothetical protein